MIHTYPPLNLEVRTQRLTLAGATDGRGIGAEMRAAVLHLASAGLGVREATSDAFTDNHASNHVSRVGQLHHTAARHLAAGLPGSGRKPR
jgi:hypothetical protein